MTRHPREGMRARWIEAVTKSKTIDEATRGLLLYLAIKMGDHARFNGATRADLAHTFDVDQRRIAERFQRAQKAGLLSRAGGGYNGKPAIWEALLPDPRSAA